MVYFLSIIIIYFSIVPYRGTTPFHNIYNICNINIIDVKFGLNSMGNSLKLRIHFQVYLYRSKILMMGVRYFE